MFTAGLVFLALHNIVQDRWLQGYAIACLICGLIRLVERT